MSEYDTLLAFLDDLNEQCGMFATDSKSAFAKKVIADVQWRIVAAGLVVLIEKGRKGSKEGIDP